MIKEGLLERFLLKVCIVFWGKWSLRWRISCRTFAREVPLG